MTATPTSAVPHVKVSLDVIYGELVTLRGELAALGVQDVKHDVADHEDRIRKLEAWIWRASGIAAAAGAAGGSVLTGMLGKLG